MANTTSGNIRTIASFKDPTWRTRQLHQIGSSIGQIIGAFDQAKQAREQEEMERLQNELNGAINAWKMGADPESPTFSALSSRLRERDPNLADLFEEMRRGWTARRQQELAPHEAMMQVQAIADSLYGQGLAPEIKEPQTKEEQSALALMLMGQHAPGTADLVETPRIGQREAIRMAFEQVPPSVAMQALEHPTSPAARAMLPAPELTEEQRWEKYSPQVRALIDFGRGRFDDLDPEAIQALKVHYGLEPGANVQLQAAVQDRRIGLEREKLEFRKGQEGAAKTPKPPSRAEVRTSALDLLRAKRRTYDEGLKTAMEQAEGESFRKLSKEEKGRIEEAYREQVGHEPPTPKAFAANRLAVMAERIAKEHGLAPEEQLELAEMLLNDYIAWVQAGMTEQEALRHLLDPEVRELWQHLITEEGRDPRDAMMAIRTQLQGRRSPPPRPRD